MKTALEWKTYYNSPEFLNHYIYEGTDLGAVCTEEGTSFLLWSPSSDKVTLNLDRGGDGGRAFRKMPMKREEKGVWSWRTEKELHGVYYDFTIERDQERIRSADPWAKACGLNGKRSMAVNLKRTNPEGWEKDAAPPVPGERIIYELHVKEFSWDESGGFPEPYRGKYKAFTCTDTTLYGDGIHPTGIPYLKKLGVTYIQLMPCFDYGSVNEEGDVREFNWGYDPVNYNVPEGSYATDPRRGEVRIREMKEMVQSLHRQGFRVIMDVVYNHTYSLDSWFQRTAPWYFYRVHEDGRVSDGSACGNDVASERTMCGNYILQSVLYWAEEYHIDGFRFDLMGLLDVDLINRIRSALDARYGKGEKLLFGEPWAAEGTAMEGGAVPALKKNLQLLDENVGIFSDDTRDTLKGSALLAEEPGFVSGAPGLEQEVLGSASAWCLGKGSGQRAKAPSQIITYLSCHDNQTLWDKISDTVPRQERMRVNRMAAAVCLTCQGTPFLLSGEEFARTKGGRDNTYNAPIALNCLDWERAWQEQDLVEYYRGLIALRRQLPGLCDKSVRAAGRMSGLYAGGGVVRFLVDNRDKERESPWDRLLLIYNGSRKKQKYLLPEENWEILVDAESSTRWKQREPAGKTAFAEPLSVLVLGHRKTRAAEEKETMAEKETA